MESLFIKSYIPDSTMLKIDLGNGIHLHEDNNSIYFLADALVVGLITENFKRKAHSKLINLIKPVIYVTMFDSKVSFAKSKQNVAWGTYVWFADNPNHYIHFDNSPSIKFPFQNAMIS